MPELADDPSNPSTTLTRVPETVAAASVPAEYDYAFLYTWQQEALRAWHANARRGVIEAVTRAGKTRVGIAAAFEAVRQGIKVLILVREAADHYAEFSSDVESCHDFRRSTGRAAHAAQVRADPWRPVRRPLTVKVDEARRKIADQGEQPVLPC